ncbi:MAG TPA: hypothetical protein VKZ49_07570 [Polyangiaceae bacterium]|nr:hypothetical protein [Polyangiaceae bacterium]
MGIDGIGKPGSGLPPGAVSQTSVPAAGTEPFKISGGDAAQSTSASDALRELEQGNLTLDQYLDGRVDKAVEHLQGRLSPEQLEFVRESVREQLRTDPALVELVRRATGSVPADAT